MQQAYAGVRMHGRTSANHGRRALGFFLWLGGFGFWWTVGQRGGKFGRFPGMFLWMRWRERERHKQILGR